MPHPVLNNTPVRLALSEPLPGCLRISLYPASDSYPQEFLSSPWLDLPSGVPTPQTVSPESLTAWPHRTGSFTVTASADPLTLEVRNHAGRVVQTLTFDTDTGDVCFPVGDAVYGLGQGFAGSMDRRGRVYDMRTHGQVRSSVDEYAAVSAVPYLVSPAGWGLFFHLPVRGVLDLTGNTGRFSARPAAYRDLFVLAADRPEEAATLYYRLTGLPAVPPRYAFGYQQSYRELVHRGESIVLPTARLMRERKIPCDVLIYLGRYVHNGWNTTGENGMFEFNPAAFPDPPAMIRELQDLGYAVVLHITETPSALHGSLEDFGVSPLEYDHVTQLWARHEELYRRVHHDGWWPDDGDELDLAAVRARYRMYRDGTERLTPGTRGFYMLRSGYCGDTRYGGVIWSGDVLSRWSTLRNQVQIGQNVSLSLNPFWGSDIGGFHVTEEYSGELYLRWLQYSVFTPMFRSHGRHSFLHTPWGWTVSGVRDIPDEWVPALADNMSDAVLPDHRVESVARRFIELRYRLIPYIYTLARQAADRGLPMIRPLWFRYPEFSSDEVCAGQYLFGDALLVHPVTEKGAVTWTTRLPDGIWYDFFTGRQVPGSGAVTRPVTIGDLPVYVPAGTILPLGEVRQRVGTEEADPLSEPVTVRVYEGADGDFTLIEDDGITDRYRAGETTKTTFTWRDAEGLLSVRGRSAVCAGADRVFRVKQVPSGRISECVCRYEPMDRD